MLVWVDYRFYFKGDHSCFATRQNTDFFITLEIKSKQANILYIPLNVFLNRKTFVIMNY